MVLFPRLSVAVWLMTQLPGLAVSYPAALTSLPSWVTQMGERRSSPSPCWLTKPYRPAKICWATSPVRLPP